MSSAQGYCSTESRRFLTNAIHWLGGLLRVLLLPTGFDDRHFHSASTSVHDVYPIGMLDNNTVYYWSSDIVTMP